MKKGLCTLCCLLMVTVASFAQTYEVVFNVDMSSAEGFDPSSDQVFITGSMLDWAEPGTLPDIQELTDEDSDMIYSIAIADIDEGEIAYKFFKNAGWDGGEWSGDPNRILMVNQNMVANHTWGEITEPGGLTLSYQGNSIEEGAIISFSGTADVDLEIAGFVVTNESSEEIPVLCKKEYITVGTNDEVTMYWDEWYDASIMVSTNAVVIAAGASSNEASFEGLYNAFEDGMYQVRWTFFNENDDSQSVSFISDITIGTLPSYDITFNVDMTEAEGFDPAIDVIYITGSLLGWAEPGTDPANQTMSDEDGDMIYTKTLSLEVGTYQYKYFLNNGWDGGEWSGDPNREITVSSSATFNDIWGVIDPETALSLTYNDEAMEEGATITFYDGLPMEELPLEGIQVFNSGGTAIPVLCQKEYIAVGENDEVTMFWGEWYDESVMISTNALTIEAGTGSEMGDFVGGYLAEIVGVYQVKWTFFNENNVDEAVSFISEVVVGTVPTVELTLNVDMDPAVQAGIFSPDTDVVYVTGSFFEWAEPGTLPANQTLTDEDEDLIYSVTISVMSGTHEYKYFLNDGWDGGEWVGGDNRVIEVQSSALDVYDIWGTVGVDETNIADAVVVAPNPCGNTLMLSNIEDVDNIKVVSITGQVLMNWDIENETALSFSVAELQSGCYFVVFTNHENRQGMKKIIKQ